MALSYMHLEKSATTLQPLQRELLEEKAQTALSFIADDLTVYGGMHDGIAYCRLSRAGYDSTTDMYLTRVELEQLKIGIPQALRVLRGVTPEVVELEPLANQLGGARICMNVYPKFHISYKEHICYN